MTKSSDAMDDGQSESASSSGLEQATSNHWVTRDRFIQLLLSHQRLVRCDDQQTRQRGLMNPTTGECFFIGEQDLLNPPSALAK